MLVNRRFDGIIVVLVAGIIAYVALQPAYRLRESAPPEFMRETHRVSIQKRLTEEKIARGYWRCAVTDVQWQYGYGHRLPSSPPPEFLLAAQEYGPEAADGSSRARYWAKLQELWFAQGSWEKEYGFNSQWLRQWFEAAGNWIEVQAHRLAR
jgi:hypothetical protein